MINPSDFLKWLLVFGVGTDQPVGTFATQLQVQQTAFNKGVDTGASDAYSIALSPAITSYTNGLIIDFTPLNSNLTTTPTLSVNGLTARTIVLSSGSPVVASDLTAGDPVLLLYNSASGTFTLINPAISSGVLPAALTRTNDTNVTLTLSGTPSTSLLQSVGMTLGWTGQLGVIRGGTGLSSTTVNQLLYSSANNVVSGLATANSATLVTSAGGVPSFSQTLPTAVQTNITELGVQSLALNMGAFGINSLAAPLVSSDAATKGYVDSIAAGLNPQEASAAASTVSLTATYNNGSSGVGATLTNAGTQVAFSIDGVTPTVGQRILIKNQSTGYQNGVYDVTVAGSGSTNWVLTRSSNYNTPLTMNETSLIPVIAGTVNAGTGWLQTATIVSVGVTALVFTQFGQTAGIIPVSNGGTGLGSTTINQLLYSSANNVISGLATINNGVLVTGSSGIPSISTTLPSGLTIPGYQASITPAALTKTDDTNVTMTLTGTPATALLQAAGMTLGWTGTLSPIRGGTGVNNGASTLTLGGSLTTSGAFASTFTMTAATNVTFPNSGTLATTSNASGIVNSGLINQLAWYSAAGTAVSGLPIVNSAGLTTTSGGVPTWVAATGTGAPVFAVGPTIQLPAIKDLNNNFLLSFGYVSSAVNSIVINNAATGNSPVILAGGSDTNVGIKLLMQGTSPLVIASQNPTTPLQILSGGSYLHVTNFAFPNSIATQTLSFPDVTGTVTVLGNNVSGSGSFALVTSPVFVTPTLGVASATSINFGGGALSNYAPPAVWTPTISFATPGNLSVSYSTQMGTWSRIGNLVIVSFVIACIPTYTTASGGLTITLPVTASSAVSIAPLALENGQSYPANCTQVLIKTNSNNLLVTTQGSGGTFQYMTTTQIVSGASLVMEGSITYLT